MVHIINSRSIAYLSIFAPFLTVQLIERFAKVLFCLQTKVQIQCHTLCSQIVIIWLMGWWVTNSTNKAGLMSELMIGKAPAMAGHLILYTV